MPFIRRVVEFCCRRAGLVALGTLLLGLVAGIYSVQNFALDSDTTKLISPHLPWRQREMAFDAAFPQLDKIILVVVDGATPERTEQAAAALSAGLAARKDVFLSVVRPDGGPFFDRNGLLYLSPQDVKTATQQLIKAQPFLGALAQDPSLRGIAESLSTALLGVTGGETKLEDLDRALSSFADVLSQIVDGKSALLSWRSLITGTPPGARETRRFIEVWPKLDYGELSPGAKATGVVRGIAAHLNLSPATGASVRLTGPVPLADEEFASLAERAGLMTSVMFLLVSLMLWLAVGSARIILAILATLFVGLAVTTTFGLVVFGALNLISVGFIALFVGLGVDFGIQFSVRYRAERRQHDDLDRALADAASGVGGALALAAAATAAGFFAVLPTDYVGVAELGLIAGAGMIVAFALNLTLLPALLKLLRPAGEKAKIGFAFLAPIDRFIELQHRWIVIAAGAIGLACLALSPALKFDFNPLDLKNPKAESTATLFDLMKDRETSSNTIDVLAPSLVAAAKIAARASVLPEVAEVITLNSFVPDHQQEKLADIQDAAMLLDTTFNPFIVKPAPGDAEIAASLAATARDLRAAAGDAASRAADDARRLADVFEQIARGSPDLRARAAAALVPGLKTLLAQLGAALQAQQVSLQSPPPELARDWLTPDGRARVLIIPSSDPNDTENLKRFTRAVLGVVPFASGGAISIRESGRTIVGAFIQAGIWSFLSIVLLLAITLRNVHDVAFTLVPLILTGLLTVGTAVVTGLPLNFANIITLPLLFGIGVAFNIYFVIAWRKGARNLLQSSLARAVLFSALTTASAFGTLWLSSHRGMASMGELLTISLGWTLVTALFFLPALLRAASRE